MKDVTIDDVVAYLNSITTHESQTWRLVINRNGAGKIDSGGSACCVTEYVWSSIEDLKRRIVNDTRQAAEKRVLGAAKAWWSAGSGVQANTSAALRDAVIHLDSFGADHD